MKKQETPKIVVALSFFIAVFLFVSCAPNSSRPTPARSSSVSSPPRQESRQEIERKGKVELVVAGFLPVPVLKSEQGSYILDVTPQSNLPPGMVVDGKVGWRPGASFSVKGYVSGKKGTIWNSEKRTTEEVPVLHVLSMTEL